jgi:S1-C subfamily serine protease
MSDGAVQDRPFGGVEPWPGHDAGMPAPPGHQPWPAPPSGRPPRRPSGLIAAIVAALLIFTAGAGIWLIQRPGATSSITRGSTGSVTDARAAVVDINTSTQASTGDGLQPLGAGTGMILTSSGQVLTNNHVVAGASSIQVSIEGRSSPVPARVLGVDVTDDVALLQLEGVSGLPTVTIGDPTALQLGDPITAMGNAFGRGGAPSVTKGSVTALNRSIVARDPSSCTSEHLANVIQTDAEIHPGDSGGAMLNADGQVVGMITAGPSGQTGTSTPSVGFAIPVSSALDIVSQIRSGQGSSSVLLGDRGFLGVRVAPLCRLSSTQLAQIQQQIGVDPRSGAVIVGFAPNSPASTAGMTAPAVIKEFDGHTITSIEDLGTVIHAHTPGEQASVTWVDRQGSHTATVSLIPGPAV